MQIRLESARQPEVVALIDALDAYQKPLYPAESHHGIDIDALTRPEVLFAVVRDDAGTAVGCGAIVVDAQQLGELKRMFVLPAVRGSGVGGRLLAFLEDEARQRGCTRFALETGIYQPQALALYERAGYRRGGPFGDYRPDPMSVFMSKAA